MLTVIRVFNVAAFIIYSAAAVIYIRDFVRNRDDQRKARVAVLCTGILIEFIAVVMYTVYLGQAPFVGMIQSFSFAACILSLIFIFSTRNLNGEKAVGALTIQLVALFQLGGVLMPLSVVTSPELRPDPWFIGHVSLALFANGAFTMAFASALLYLLLHKQIKAKRLGWLFERLPPLDELDFMTYRLVGLGFITLTLSILTGLIWNQLTAGKIIQGDIKEVATFFIWLVYALYFHSRFHRGWSGRRSAMLVIGGFIFLLINFTLITVFLSHTHRYI